VKAGGRRGGCTEISIQWSQLVERRVQQPRRVGDPAKKPIDL